MKDIIKRRLPAAAALLLILLFGHVLLLYVHPMEDVSLDLSLSGSEEAIMIDPVDFDDKGWSVYTRDGETVTGLTPNGLGGYAGLELGQTFYFSRVMEEALDSPILQLAAQECTFSVWLDGVLLYTDCPELDNRIGYVTLPMNDQFRDGPILISMPMDYPGKTLTIAQSFPEYTETGSVRAWPTAVRLYCGYAYESELISESFRTAFLAAALFLLGLFLLGAFVRNRDWSVLCLSLTALLQMTMQFRGTTFFWKYYGTDSNAVGYVLPLLSAGALFVFLAMRGGKYRRILWGLTGSYLGSVVIAGVLLFLLPVIHAGSAIVDFLTHILPFWLAFGCIIMVLVLGVVFWWKENKFYRLFTPLAFAGIALYWLAVALVLERGIVRQQLLITLGSGDATYLYYRTFPAVTVAALIVAVADAIRQAVSHHTEKAAMEERREMALESYENMRRQHEEIMMLRHDMMKHFQALRGMSDQAQATDYLDDIIGRNERIRPVVQSGNQMLDIILNSKLSAAMDAGIRVEVVRTSAPEKLPLSDADLCSLVMNVMDNAADAAGRAGSTDPFIRLDIHIKNDFLSIVCENSANITMVEQPEKKETVPKHGLGLNIIRGITERYHGLIDTEYDGDCYKVRIAIPLF